jgi:hypothetical protein
MTTGTRLDHKFRNYYATAIVSLLFALIGFSYNAWRMEASEDNSNIRTAAFEVLTELAELQQLIFAAHYDKDPVAGNPRVGWVKVELIGDLSTLIGEQTHRDAIVLQQTWRDNWAAMADDSAATDELIASIDRMRAAVKDVTAGLK